MRAVVEIDRRSSIRLWQDDTVKSQRDRRGIAEKSDRRRL
jgi:hypothetical protein